MSKTLMAVDGNSLMHRAFHALPLLTNREGEYTNAVYGFFSMLINALAEYKPDYLAIAFDMKEKTFRHKIFKEYKALRKPTPSELIPQFDILKNALYSMGITVIESEGYEADDILGVLSLAACGHKVATVLLTGDKDAFSLISGYCSVLLTRKGVSLLELYDTDKLFETYALEPKQIADLKGFMGDKSDNIPGVAGVGEKTALNLLHSYGDMEGVYENIEEIKGKLKDKLIQNKDMAFLSRKLARIDVHAPIPVNIDALMFNGLNENNAGTVFKKLGFTSLLNRIGAEPAPPPRPKTMSIETMEELKSLIRKNSKASRAAIVMGDDISVAFTAESEYSIVTEHSLLNTDFTRGMALGELKALFGDSELTIIMYDAKSAVAELSDCGIDIKCNLFDVKLAEYVIDPSSASLGFGKLAEKYNIGGSAAAILSIFGEQIKKLEDDKLWYVYNDIEMPLMRVLIDMECTGFRIDLNMLGGYNLELTRRIDNLTRNIHLLADDDGFNINSTKQLGRVLFEQLGLPAVKTLKSGYSTDIEVLEKLSGKHPIIDKLIEYRRLTKLKSTYIDALSKIADSDGFVRTTFVQISTVTGRISSKEPNLQNIPVRTREGREIRRLFLPSTDSRMLVAADYSQIELRILASISGDGVMKDAFNSNIDIHTRTASEVFEVPAEQVTEQLRRSAKAVNFGIVYGISDFGLARNLNIPVKKAARYIERYFERFSGVRQYMDEIILKAKSDGYVSTLLGRRRYLPELNSRNYNIRSFGERAALNTPIQGTAADIIKLAMINVWRELRKGGFSSKLILQVHDELIVDTALDETEEVKALLKRCMENAYPLNVPLVAEVSAGRNWLDAK